MRDLVAERIEAGAGGGKFQLRDMTVGIFLTDQPAHRLSIGSDRRQHRPLAAREGWMLPAGAEGICEFDAPLQFVTVALPAPLLAEVGLTRAVEPAVGKIDPLVTELVLNAPSLRTGSLIYRQTMARALAAQIAATAAPVPADAARLDDTRLARAVGYIHDHLADDLSLDDIASQAAMSGFHFSRAFKAATGRSPLQYVIRARVDLAKLLLATTALPVAEIAFRSGYADVSRFGQHFKRQVGVTPGAYRAGS